MNFIRHVACIGWFVTLSTLVGLGYCVPTVVAIDSCDKLDVFPIAGITEPIPGDDLRYCSTSNLQCCTSAYFVDLKSSLMEDLSVSVVLDLQPVLALWRQTVALSEDTLDQFLVDFFENLPLPSALRTFLEDYLKEQEEILRSQLSPEFDVDLDYDFKTFVENLTIHLVNSFADMLLLSPAITTEDANCVRTVLLDHIDSIDDTLIQIESQLAELQLVYQTMNKINLYMGSVNSSQELNYQPSEECVSAVIGQFCDACFRDVPPACQTVCGPIVAGCQAPLRDNLAGQFDAVWNVSRQVADLAFHYMNLTLRVELPRILSSTVLSEEINPRSVEECGVNLLPFLLQKRFVPSIDLPPSLSPWVEHTALLQGTLTYDPVPAFCDLHSSPQECWNGSHTLQNGSVSVGQLGMGICDQEPGNPFDIHQLYEQAVQIGTPVLDFLDTVNLTETLPRGVDMPKVPPMKPPPTTMPTTSVVLDDKPNGAATLSHSHWLLWATLALLIMVSLDRTRT